MVKFIRLIGVFVLSFLPIIGYTLGLGNLRLNSSLNQPLNAEIEVVSLEATHKEDVKFSIASQASFDAVGISRPFFLNKIRFDWALKDNRQYVRLSTANPVKEPFLNFLIEVNWPNGRIVREYTVLLNPPMYSNSVPPVVVSPREVYTKVNQIEREQVKEPVTVSKRPRSKPSVILPTPVFPEASLKQQTDTEETSESKPAYRVSSSANYPSNSTYGPIVRGETLWGIALKTRPSKAISPNDMIRAIYDANPDAFINGDVNRVKAGYHLTMPTLDQLHSIQLQEEEQILSKKKSSAIQGKENEQVKAVSSTTKKSSQDLLTPWQKSTDQEQETPSGLEKEATEESQPEEEGNITSVEDKVPTTSSKTEEVQQEEKVTPSPKSPQDPQTDEQVKITTDGTQTTSEDRLRVITPTDSTEGKATTNVANQQLDAAVVQQLRELKDKLLLTNETLDATKRQNELLAKELASLKEELVDVKKQLVLKDSILAETKADLLEAKRALAKLHISNEQTTETPLSSDNKQTSLPGPFETESRLAKVATSNKTSSKRTDDNILDVILNNQNLLLMLVSAGLGVIMLIWILGKRAKKEDKFFDDDYDEEELTFDEVSDEIYSNERKHRETTQKTESDVNKKRRSKKRCPGYELNELSDEELEQHAAPTKIKKAKKTKVNEVTDPEVPHTLDAEELIEKEEISDADPLQLAEQFINESLFDDAEVVLIESILENPADMRLIATLCKIYSIKAQQTQFDKTMLLVPHSQRDPLDSNWSEIIRLRESTWPDSEWPTNDPSEHTTVDDLNAETVLARSKKTKNNNAEQQLETELDVEQVQEQEPAEEPPSESVIEFNSGFDKEEEITNEKPWDDVASESPEVPNGAIEVEEIPQYDDTHYRIEWPSTQSENKPSPDEQSATESSIESGETDNLEETEAETRLNLAKAYIDMNDIEGATDILNEVLQSGTDAQKKEAETLLNRLQNRDNN